MFPSVRHLYTAASDGETITCVTCELQVQPSPSLKTFSRITTFIFARIMWSLQTSRGEFCQRSSVLPNWSFSHYVHSCLGQVSRLWSVSWGGRWLWLLANLLACKLGCVQTWLLANLLLNLVAGSPWCRFEENLRPLDRLQPGGQRCAQWKVLDISCTDDQENIGELIFHKEFTETLKKAFLLFSSTRHFRLEGKALPTRVDTFVDLPGALMSPESSTTTLVKT